MDLKPLLTDAAQRSARYLDSLQERSVAPSKDGVHDLAKFDLELQDHPMDPDAVLRELDEIGSPATMGIAGPRFFGFVMGGSLPAALAADFMTSAWDQNTGLYNVTPATARLEQVALRWMLELLDLPRETAGAFVTGTTVAHITALAAARHAVLAKAGWNVEADGLFGAPPIAVLVSDEVHPTLLKALGVLGMGRNRVTRIPTDAQGRIRLDALPRISGPTVLCAQAGNVNTGACDPLIELCDLAHAHGGWVHVDGAFGLWARVAPSRAHLVNGLERADSWATDGHKWLNVPYDSGIALTRDGEALRKAMAVTAEYLPSITEGRNPSDYTPELSRRARGVTVWAALRSLGREGLTELVERNCRQARRFAEALSQAGFEVLSEVHLNQVLVAFGDSDQTRRTIAALQDDGTCWCGATVWQGRTAMRISVCSWATTDEDVERSIAAMVRVARG
jgi:glutamate/tyrosine decarboxylase-like PLP-dependent enzyme